MTRWKSKKQARQNILKCISEGDKEKHNTDSALYQNYVLLNVWKRKQKKYPCIVDKKKNISIK